MGVAFVVEGFDGRAEGRRREVEVTRERVIIARRVGRVEMRIGLEVRQYRGVALGVLIAEATDFLYTVTLTHADPELSVMLASFAQESDARSAWRRWASKLGLNRLIERAEGEYEIAAGDPLPLRERRRGRATLQRRNRFLARRKMGRIVAGGLQATYDLS